MRRKEERRTRDRIGKPIARVQLIRLGLTERLTDAAASALAAYVKVSTRYSWTGKLASKLSATLDRELALDSQSCHHSESKDARTNNRHDPMGPRLRRPAIPARCAISQFRPMSCVETQVHTVSRSAQRMIQLRVLGCGTRVSPYRHSYCKATQKINDSG